MKEAIEILDYIRLREARINKLRTTNNVPVDDISFNSKLIELAYVREFILQGDYSKWQPSPDTPYKIELTKWIEKKKWFEAYERIKDTDAIHKGSPYSFFESWQKAQDKALTTGRGAVSVSLNSNNELEVKHVDILDHEEGQG